MKRLYSQALEQNKQVGNEENAQTTYFPVIPQDQSINMVNAKANDYYAQWVAAAQLQEFDLNVLLHQMRMACVNMLDLNSDFIKFIQYTIKYNHFYVAHKLIDAFSAMYTNNTPILIYLIQSGYAQYIKLFCAAKIDVNAVDIHNNTALDIAFDMKNVELCYLLLQHGCTMVDMNRPDAYGDTLLMFAVIRKHELLVNLLCHLKVNTNIFNYSNSATALTYAVDSENPNIIQCLLNAGADPNLRDHLGHTLLMTAVLNNNPSMVAKLCKWVKPNLELVTHSSKKSALTLASDHDFQEVAYLLLQLGAIKSINDFNRYGNTLTLLAINANNVPLLELLYAKKANFNVFHQGCADSIAKHAFEDEKLDIIKKLLQWNWYSLDINCQNTNGNTLLMLALKAGDEKFARLLLNYYKADINIINTKLQRTALHYAIEKDMLFILDFIHSQTCFIEYTPLMHASYCGKTQWIPLLLKLRNDLEFVNYNDKQKTALCYAVQNKKREAAMMLKEYGAEVNHLLSIKKYNGNVVQANLITDFYNVNEEVLQLLYDLGADFTVQGDEQRTVMQYAEYYGLYHIVKKLIELGLYANEDIAKMLSEAEKNDFYSIFGSHFYDTFNKENLLALLELKAKFDDNPECSIPNPVLKERNNTMLHRAVYSGNVNIIKTVAYHPIENEKQLYTFSYKQVDYVKDLEPNTLYVYKQKKHWYCKFKTINITEKGMKLYFSESVTLAQLQTKEMQNNIVMQIQSKHKSFGERNRFFNSAAANIKYQPKNGASYTPIQYLKKFRPQYFADLLKDLVAQNIDDGMPYFVYNFISQAKNVWCKIVFNAGKQSTQEKKKLQALESGLNILYHPVLPTEIKSLIWEYARTCPSQGYTPQYSLRNDKQAFVAANCLAHQVNIKEREREDGSYLHPGKIIV